MFEHKKLSRPSTKKWVGQTTWWANKLSGPNIKLGGLVLGRPTRSAVTAVTMVILK